MPQTRNLRSFKNRRRLRRASQSESNGFVTLTAAFAVERAALLAAAAVVRLRGVVVLKFGCGNRPSRNCGVANGDGAAVVADGGSELLVLAITPDAMRNRTYLPWRD